MIKKNIIIDDLNIAYYISDIFSQENPLVFLHGWQSSALLFKNVLEKCDNFVAIELPGFNGSEISETPWTLDDYASFLNNFLVKLGIKNPTLAGHSFGGNIILKYLFKGWLAKKAILIDSSGVRKKTIKIWVFYFISKLIKILYIIPGIKILVKKNRKKFYKIIKSEDYVNSGRLRETYKNVINEDLSTKLSQINIKTFIIWGKNDTEAPLKQAQILSSGIKNSELFVIDNTGHFPFLDKPEEFNEIFFKILKC